jgi:hypothetical protein
MPKCPLSFSWSLKRTWSLLPEGLNASTVASYLLHLGVVVFF